MCRWLAYSGAPIFLDEVLFKTDHSLIDQSLRAFDKTTTTNGDGFGIGWYGVRDVPGVYKDIRPAWNDTNLQALAAQIESPMFLAHVRATTGSPVQRSNCHPFNYRKWLFVHNGLIGEYEELRRDPHVCDFARVIPTHKRYDGLGTYVHARTELRYGGRRTGRRISNGRPR